MLRLLKFSALLLSTVCISQSQVAIYVISGPNLPSKCSIKQGAIYFKTTGGAGVQGLYQCGLTDDNWTYVGTSDSGSISGSGTTNYITKFVGSTSIGNSVATDDGTTYTIPEATSLGTPDGVHGSKLCWADSTGSNNLCLVDPVTGLNANVTWFNSLGSNDGTEFLTINSGVLSFGTISAGTVTSSGSPTSGNIPKFTTATNIAPAAATDIVGLFSTCSGTRYLGADGACHTPGTSPTTNQNLRNFGCTFGDFSSGASALSAAQICYRHMPVAGTINKVTLNANASGTITVDVKTHTGTWTGCAAASSIAASDIPALSSGITYSDTTLTGWTTAVTAGTDFCFVSSSPSTLTGATITIEMAAN